MAYLAGLQFRMNVWPEGPDVQIKPQSLQGDVWASVISTFYTVDMFLREVLYNLQVVGNALSLPIKAVTGTFTVVSALVCREWRQGQNPDPDFQYISWSAYQIPKTFSIELLIIFHLNFQTRCSFPPFIGKGPAISFPARNTH